MADSRLEKLHSLQIKKGNLLNDIKTFNELLMRSKEALSDVNEEIEALKVGINS